MKKQGKRQAFCCMAAAAMLAMSACGQVPAVEQGGSPPQVPEENAESQMPERTLSETVLLSGKETQVFLEIGDGKIVLWDQPAGGEMLAEAAYPQEIPNAAEVWDGCDFTDLDGDGNSDLTADLEARRAWFGSFPMVVMHIMKSFPNSPEKPPGANRGDGATHTVFLDCIMT